MSSVSVPIETLTAEERLELLERLWASLSADPGRVPVTETQRRELDRRLDDLEADAQASEPLGIPWDEVLSRVRGR